MLQLVHCIDLVFHDVHTFHDESFGNIGVNFHKLTESEAEANQPYTGSLKARV